MKVSKSTILALLLGISILTSCSKHDDVKGNEPCNKEKKTEPSKAVYTKVLYGPVSESKFYKLFSGFSSGDNFEASGVFALGNYYYAVFDNRKCIAKVLNTLPQVSSSNSFIGSTSTSTSNYEGITYDNYSTPNWYVVIETAKNGSKYYPKFNEYDANFTLQNANWTNYSFSSSNSNKGFEGVAYLRRNNIDYILGIVEGTGKVAVMQQSGNAWNKVTEFTIPVSMGDYSDIAIYGSKIAITSQQDSKVWVGTLSTTTWAITGNSTTYSFPKGDANGNVSSTGTNTIYANVEGVSFINDTTIVTCTDKADGGDPSYKKTKDQSIQVFKLR